MGCTGATSTTTGSTWADADAAAAMTRRLMWLHAWTAQRGPSTEATAATRAAPTDAVRRSRCNRAAAGYPNAADCAATMSTAPAASASARVRAALLALLSPHPLKSHAPNSNLYTRFFSFCCAFICPFFVFSFFNFMHFFLFKYFLYFIAFAHLLYLIRCSTHFLLCVVVVVVSFSFSTPHTSFRFATLLCNLRVDRIQGCCEIANKIFARQLNNFYLL